MSALTSSAVTMIFVPNTRDFVGRCSCPMGRPTRSSFQRWPKPFKTSAPDARSPNSPRQDISHSWKIRRDSIASLPSSPVQQSAIGVGPKGRLSHQVRRQPLRSRFPLPFRTVVQHALRRAIGQIVSKMIRSPAGSYQFCGRWTPFLQLLHFRESVLERVGRGGGARYRRGRGKAAGNPPPLKADIWSDHRRPGQIGPTPIYPFLWRGRTPPNSD